MKQVARNVTMDEWGFLENRRYLLHDRDSKFCRSFRRIIESGPVTMVPLPACNPKQTIVKDYVRERRRRLREMFVPLAHPPGHAQADFGEADAIIAGVERRAHFFVMTLPHSDACFVAAYPAVAASYMTLLGGGAP